MGRPSLAEGKDRAAKLVAAAESEFAAHGFAAARLEDVAAAVGLTRSSLLHHFPTKQALYAAVIEALFARLRGALVAGMATRGTFEERLVATAGGFAKHLLDDPTAARLLVRELQDAKGPGVRLMREQVVPLLELAEAFVRESGGAQVPAGLDVRAAILDLVGSVVFCAIAEPVRRELWGPARTGRKGSTALRRHVEELAKCLLLQPIVTKRSAR